MKQLELAAWRSLWLLTLGAAWLGWSAPAWTQTTTGIGGAGMGISGGISGGGSFSGSGGFSGGGSFSGISSSGSFGGQSTTTIGFLGGTSQGGPISNTNVTGITTTNPFRPSYYNPYSFGAPSPNVGRANNGVSGPGSFGQAVYLGTTGGGAGGMGMAGSMGAGGMAGMGRGMSMGGMGGMGMSGMSGMSMGAGGMGMTGMTSSMGMAGMGRGSGMGMAGMSGMGMSGMSGMSMGGMGMAGMSGMGMAGMSGMGGMGGMGMSGGMGAAGGMRTTGMTSGVAGFTTFGYRRTPTYVTTLGRTIQPVQIRPAAGLAASVQGIIQRSTSLPSRNGIAVIMDGPTVVLRGLVQDPYERQLAENLIRLTPGVRDIRNELQVNGGAAGMGP